MQAQPQCMPRGSVTLAISCNLPHGQTHGCKGGRVSRGRRGPQAKSKATSSGSEGEEQSQVEASEEEAEKKPKAKAKKKAKAKAKAKDCHVSRATGHAVSRVACHASDDLCRTSRVTCHV